MILTIIFHKIQNIRIRILKALQRNSKKSSSMDLLGCSIEFLKYYLQRKFKKGMNWKNYGLYGWHIDHIKPCCAFDLTKTSEQYKCFNYKNLQPLWAEENLVKSMKFRFRKKSNFWRP